VSAEREWDSWGIETGEDFTVAEPGTEMAVVNQGVLFIPYHLVGIVRCEHCQDDFANRTFLREHQAAAHAAPTDTTPGQRPLVPVGSGPPSGAVRAS
jgi:hypothetical protein